MSQASGNDPGHGGGGGNGSGVGNTSMCNGGGSGGVGIGGIPPREEWGGHASSLLRILGSDPDERRERLLRTLELFDDSAGSGGQSGAGAVEARDFYRYVLEVNNTGCGESADTPEPGESLVSPAAAAPASPTTRRASSQDVLAATSKRRGPGRPRKSDAIEDTNAPITVPSIGSISGWVGGKRGRGRPPGSGKRLGSGSSPSPCRNHKLQRRGPGRPPGSKNKKKSSGGKHSKARTKVTITTATATKRSPRKRTRKKKNDGKAKRQIVLYRDAFGKFCSKAEAVTIHVCGGEPGKEGEAEYSEESIEDEEEQEEEIQDDNDDDGMDEEEFEENEFDEQEGMLEETEEVDGAATKSFSPGIEDFLDAHNDLCQVCDIGGEVLCCSTCNLVFHLECVRPITKKLPPDDWSCAYCVAAGVRGYKRESNIRRKAFQAVREMDKPTYRETCQSETKARIARELEMREQERKANEAKASEVTSRPQERDNSVFGVESAGKVGKADSRGKNGAGEKVLSDSSVGQYNSATPPEPSRKRKTSSSLARELVDLVSPDINFDQPRTRRLRHQPVLYDPQLCSASQWQSDKGLNSSPSMGDGVKKDGDEKRSRSRSSSSKDRKGRSSCSFCRGDPSIPACCFCACRVCFRKGDQDRLIQCDKCGTKYHAFCLDNALLVVSKSWHCPPCRQRSCAKDSKAPDVSVDISQQPDFHGQSRGKTPCHMDAGDKRTEGSEVLNREPDELSKSPSTRRASHSGNLTTSASCKEPVTSSPEDNARESSNEGISSIDQGGSKDEDDNMDSVTLASSEEFAAQRPKQSGKAPVPQPQVRRSARPVKRNTFLDDIGEGEQHLRSSRYAAEQERKAKAAAAAAATAAAVAEQKKRASAAAEEETRAVERRKKKTAEEQQKAAEKKKSVIEEAKLRLKQAEERDATAAATTAETKEREEDGRARKEEDVRQLESGKSVEVDARKHPAKLGMSEEDERNGRCKVEGTLIAASRSKNVVNVPSVAPPLPAATVESLPSGEPAISAVTPAAVPASAPVATPTTAPVAAPIAAKVAEPVAAPRAPMILPLPVLPASDSTSETAAYDAKVNAATVAALQQHVEPAETNTPVKVPRRKPGARECMQISRRFHTQVIPQKYMDTLMDYCTRGKVEHLIRMRERLDEHSRMLEAQLAGLEALVREKGELKMDTKGETEQQDMNTGQR